MNEIDRRTACKLIAAGTVGAVAEFSLGFPMLRAAFHFLSEVDTSDDESVILYPRPGWVQRMYRNGPVPPLVSVPDGAKKFLRYIVTNNPVVAAAVSGTIDELTRVPQEHPPRMGTILEAASRQSNAAISRILGDANPSIESVINVSVPAMAAVLSPYFAFPAFETYAPQFLPVKPKESISQKRKRANWDGYDKTMHAAQHMGVVYEFRYSQRHGLPDAERIPKGVKLAHILTAIPELQALILSGSAGFVWEILETKWVREGRGTIEDDGVPLPSGFDDELWPMDIQANTIGALIGLILAQKNPTRETLATAIRIWNNQTLY